MDTRRITTVRDLIKQLSRFPPEWPVLVDGYESGLCDPAETKAVRAAWNENKPWYRGPHEKIDGEPNAVRIARLPNHLSDE